MSLVLLSYIEKINFVIKINDRKNIWQEYADSCVNPDCFLLFQQSLQFAVHDHSW